MRNAPGHELNFLQYFAADASGILEVIKSHDLMKYADFDYRQYPVVLIKMNPVSPTVAEQDVFFNDFEKMFSMNAQAILVLNSRDQKLISSESRIAAGQWVKKHTPDIQAKVRVVIFIESSVWLKMVLNAIFLIAKFPVPTHVLKDRESAREFVRKTYGVTFE